MSCDILNRYWMAWLSHASCAGTVDGPAGQDGAGSAAEIGVVCRQRRDSGSKSGGQRGTGRIAKESLDEGCIDAWHQVLCAASLT